MRMTYRTSFQVFIAVSLILTASSSNCRAQVTPQPSPRQSVDRESWRESMSRTPLPKHGCFHASYPSTEWQEVQCVAAPQIPHGPATAPLLRHGPTSGAGPEIVGNGALTDFSANVPAGVITEAAGDFPIVSGVAGEADSTYGTNAFSVQLNSNKIPMPCANPAGCLGWQQFVFVNLPESPSLSGVFIEYWLLNDDVCPQTWTPSPAMPGQAPGCFFNSQMVQVIPIPITDLGNLNLLGKSTSGGDLAELQGSGTEPVLYAMEQDSMLNLWQNWNTVEFNVFGVAHGSEAKFPSGSTLAVEIGLIAPSFPTCIIDSFPSEFTNLTLLPYSMPYCLTYDLSLESGTTGQIEFMENNGGAATYQIPTAAPASSVTMTSAQLNGSVNTSGLPTLAWFQYGTNSGALDCTSPTLTPVQTTSGSFSSVASPLSSGTTYYFVACALNPGGLVGTVASFITTEPPSPPH